jgi:hypothetical protein
MIRLARLVTALRTGFLRATTPSIPADARTDFGLTWLNEATLVGISVPAPRSVR